jgi:hypothetical protein
MSFLTTRSLPLRTFPRLSRRSGRFPALPYLRSGNCILTPTTGVDSEFTLNY